MVKIKKGIFALIFTILTAASVMFIAVPKMANAATIAPLYDDCTSTDSASKPFNAAYTGLVSSYEANCAMYDSAVVRSEKKLGNAKDDNSGAIVYNLGKNHAKSIEIGMYVCNNNSFGYKVAPDDYRRYSHGAAGIKKWPLTQNEIDSNVRKTYMNPDDSMIYLFDGTKWFVGEEGYIFKPASFHNIEGQSNEQIQALFDSGKLREMGVEIQASPDGVTYSTVDKKLVKGAVSSAWEAASYEVWRANFPADAKYVRLLLHDNLKIYGYTGGVFGFKSNAVNRTWTLAPNYVSIEQEESGAMNTKPQVRDICYRGYKGFMVDNTLFGEDVDGDLLTYSVVSQPPSGNVTISGGKFRYVPSNLDFTGEATFTYKANDGVEDSEVATVTIDILNTDKSYNPLTDEVVHGYADKLTLNGLFSSKMMFQQGKPIKIWGLSKPNATDISVSFGKTGSVKTVKTASADMYGDWSVEFEALSASFDKYELSISDTYDSISFNDILIGEIWIAAGQSNMELNTRFIYTAEELKKNANNENIRFFLTPQTAYGLSGNYDYYPSFYTPVGSKWGKGDNWDEVGETYGVAYTFALEAFKKLNVPVGILHAACGATGIEAWSTRGAVEDSTDLAELKNYFKPSEDAGNTVAEQLKHFNSYRTETGSGGTLWNNAGGNNYNQSTAMFNTKVAPLVGLNVSGIIWYQGENNLGNASRPFYTQLFESLSPTWSRFWGYSAPLPIVYSHLAGQNNVWGDSYYEDITIPMFNEMYSYIESRNEGRMVQVPNYDIDPVWKMNNGFGSLHPTHPLHKEPLGRRMAAAALQKVYGIGSDSFAPVYASNSITKNKMTLEFSNAQGGLRTRGGEALVKGFTLAGADGLHYVADAVIKGGIVELSSAYVPLPLYAAYGFNTLNRYCNVEGMGGVPLVPFRTERYIAQTLASPHEWLYADSLEVWDNTSVDAKYVSSFVKSSGSASLSLDIVNKIYGSASVKVNYGAGGFSVSPRLNLANNDHQLDDYTCFKFRIYNNEKRVKNVSATLTTPSNTYNLRPRSLGEAGQGWTEFVFDIDRSVGGLISRSELKAASALNVAVSDSAAGSVNIDYFELGKRAADKPQAEKPSNPTVTAYGIKLEVTPVEGCEYSLDKITWQDENIFTKLTPSTSYTVYARIKETQTHSPSQASSTVISTLAYPVQQTPAEPQYSVTQTTLTVQPLDGAEYKLGDGEWQDDNVFSGLSAGSDYVLHVRMKATDFNDCSLKVSVYLSTSEKGLRPAGQTPNFTANTNSIAFDKTEGVLFSIDDGKTWCDGSFDGLEAGKEYTFKVKYAEDESYNETIITLKASTKKDEGCTACGAMDMGRFLPIIMIFAFAAVMITVIPRKKIKE